MEFGNKLADYLRQGADTLTNLPTEAQRFLTNPQAFTQLITGKNPLPKETGFVAGATGLPAKNPVQGGVLNPASAPYQEGYEQGEPVAIASMALPAYASALRAGAPKAYNALESYMVKSGGMIPLEAYHGTPHKIKGAFDISKVGTGEGAQAYGHGMYFAENPAVATEYRKALSGRTDLGQQPSDPAFIHAVESFREYGTPLSQIPTEMKKAYKSATDKDIQLAIQATEKGNLYKVDIPDQDIPNMLDWDKPLSQQAGIIEKLKTLGDDELSKLGINPDFTRRSTGKELTGESLYDVLTTHNSQKGASNLLAKQGITGIRYFDQGSRGTVGGEIIDVFKSPEGWKSKVKVSNRGGVGFSDPTDVFTTSMPFKTEAEAKAWADNKIGKGTSNFVVFDPSNVKILEENAKPLNSLQSIVEPIRDRGLTIDAYESKKAPIITLSRIEVPKDMRGTGMGTQALQDLSQYADQSKKTIALSPSKDFGASSVNRLKDFYKRFGFVENKGKNKDFSISESMYRLPTQPTRKELIQQQIDKLE